MIHEVTARTLLSSAKQPDPWFGIKYTMNLYRGCQHQCIYCDSRSECYQIENFADVLVKVNAIDLLKQELPRKRVKGTIGTGSMSDPYLPLEAPRRLTAQRRRDPLLGARMEGRDPQRQLRRARSDGPHEGAGEVRPPAQGRGEACEERAHPLERLEALRRLAYPAPGRSLGQAPLALQSQTGFPENARFTYGRVVFVALHVIGSNNALEPWETPTAIASAAPRDGQLAAFRQREAANVAWLAAAFGQASASDAIAVVVLMQANPRFELPPGDRRRAGFEAVVDALGRLAGEFGRPVLLLHGDGHVYLVDRPLADGSPPVPNLRRVQAFGYPWTEWIRIEVDSASATVFDISIGVQRGAFAG